MKQLLHKTKCLSALLTLAVLLALPGMGWGLTSGDIAIISVNADASKTMTFVALTDIPANITITFTDNAWNASSEVWRTGEGSIAWSNTSITSKGTVVTVTMGAPTSPFSVNVGTITTNTNFNLSTSGDQVLAYEGTTAPTTNNSGLWLYGFSLENWVWANNANTSDIPTALTNAYVEMTTSTAEVDNAYFANGTTSQTAVTVSGTKSELLTLFNDASKYYKNDSGPLTIPTYSITVNTGATAPTVTTQDATSLATTSATFNGNITSDGGASITDRGFCYNTTGSVAITDNKTSEGSTGTGTFSKSFSSLSINTHYYYRAYATNSVGTTLGSSDVSFYTLANVPSAPTVNNATVTTLDVVIGGSDGNPAATTYAIHETTTGNFVQSDGTLGASAVWQTASAWGTKTVTGLTAATTYTFEVKARNGANTETAYGSSSSLATLAAPQIDWCNIQWPVSGSISLGDAFTVYAQVYEPGVTNAAGQGAGVTAWIGYGTSNTDLSGYTWVSASYNGDAGNNDEYSANLVAALTVSGNYYYASRFKLGDAAYVYGGVSGFWSSGQSAPLTVSKPITWANLQHPENGSINVGGDFNVYARVFKSGVTEAAGQGANITAWIGYNTSDTDPSTWTNWVSATYNADAGNNDEYVANIGTSLPAGTYYYASRFQYKTFDSDRVYGGYNVGGGDLWNGSAYVSGVLTVTTPEPSAHVTAFTATPNSSSTITVTWPDSDAASYLIKGSDVSYAAIIAPVDGAAEANATLVRNVASGQGTYQFTGLTANTTYFFKIFPYNGTGTAVNYKTDGSVPQASATTENLPVAAWDFTGIGSTSIASTPATTFNSNLISTSGANNITRGAGASWSNGSNSWRTQGFQNNGISTSNTDYFQITLQATSGKVLSLSAIDANFAGTASFCASPGVSTQFAYSLDGTNFTLIGTPQSIVGTPASLTRINLSSINALQNVPNGTIITLRYYASGQTSTGGWGFYSAAAGTNGLAIGGTLYSATSTFTGTGNWSDVSKWSNGIPGTATNVTINGTVTVDDVVDCNNLTIKPSGALTVGSGQGLIVNGNLLIKSDASGTGSFIGAAADYTITGTTTVERYLAKYNAVGDQMFHLISSPVAAQAIRPEFVSNEATIPAGTDFYSFSEATNEWINTRADGNVWNSSFEPSFAVGKGYLVAYPTDVTKNFTGILNSYASPLLITCTNTANEGEGWNLLGNPFPSAIDWSLVALGNGMDNALYYYDNTAQNYRYYIQLSGETGSLGSGQQYIPAMQGFMVHAKTSGTKTVSIENADRTHSGQNVFYKSTNTVPGSLSLKVTANGHEDEAFIHFNRQATAAFDGAYDAYKLRSYSEMVPNLYTKGSDGSDLAINGLPELDAATVIPVYFEAAAQGEQVLTANLDGLPNAIVYLEDSKLGKTHNLSQNPVYNFTSASGDNVNRFKLLFGSVGISTPETSSIQVYSLEGRLYVNGAPANAQLSFTDITGRMIQQVQLSNTGLNTVNVGNLPHGVYVVTVNDGKHLVSHKIIL